MEAGYAELHYTPADGKIYLVEKTPSKLRLLKSKYLWIAVYVLSITLSFAYVNALLKTGTVDVLQTKAETEVDNPKPAKVKLIVEFPTYKKEYEVNKETTDSIMDLMNTLRRKNDFKYERTSYIDRVTIDHVNGVYPQAGFEWRIFLDDKDVTQKFQDTYLIDNSVYYLKLVKL